MKFSIDKRFYVRGLTFQWIGVLIVTACLYFKWRFLLFLLGAILFIFGWVLELISHGNITFWAKVRDYPDSAYDWFKGNDHWVVVDDAMPKNADGMFSKKEWVGPFRLYVPKLGGKIVKIYAKANTYEETQQKFLQLVQTVEN